MSEATLAGKRRRILEFIAEQIRERGYPPSVREIGEAVGLTSPSTVHAHLQVLEREGYLQRDPTKPRAIIVSWEPSSGAAIRVRPVAHVPLIGHVAAGTGVLAEESVEELLPIPRDFTGSGDLFMLKDRQDPPQAAREGRARAGEPRLLRDGAGRRSGRDLRQGRHRAAAPVTSATA